MDQHNHTEDPGKPGVWYKSRWGLALIGFAAVSVLLLVYEHRLHIPFGNLFGALPLVAVFGLHLLMHSGHGGHGGHGGSRGGHGSHGKASQPTPPPESPREPTSDAAGDKRP